MDSTRWSTSGDPAHERTAELFCDARRYLAYSQLDSIASRPVFYSDGDPSDESVFPWFAEGACGYELYDSAGRSYVDWVNGAGPVILGYRHPDVERAMAEQLAAGPLLSLMHPLEVEVAALLVELIPCADTVAFGKNGSDAVNAAVRVARSVTGRELVLQYGMHGFHEWYSCTDPNVHGVPEVLKTLIRSFPYNDLDALRSLLTEHEATVAAVVMEPVRDELPEPGYLEAVRDLVHEHGALLIFDEMVTGFRLGPGGAQERYGAVPDLACFGKALANGMPLSALVGRRDLMKEVGRVAFGMTFRGETLSLAAARATLRVLRDEPVAEHLERAGDRVREAFGLMCEREGVPWTLRGPSARMTFEFTPVGRLSWDEARTLFLQECLKGGVLTNGNLLPSYAHDGTAIARTIDGLDSAVRSVAVASGPDPNGSRDGSYQATSVADGFLEVAREQDGGLRIRGWMLLGRRPADAIEFIGPSGCVVAAERVAREDLAAAFPEVERAELAGYSALLPAGDFSSNGEFRFVLRARSGNQAAFECRVVKRRGEALSSGPQSTALGLLELH